MHQVCWMGAVHLPRISGHSTTQLELYQYSRHLQVPNERPDFSFSPRFYFRQKKMCWREPGHTLPLAKQLVRIRSLKSAEVRCICTSGNPFCIFRYLKTQASKQNVWLFAGVILPKLRRSWDLLPRAGGRLSSATAVPAGDGNGGGKGQPTHVIPSSYAGNAFAAQFLSLTLAAQRGRVLADHLSCWHPDTPLVRSPSWVWVAGRLTQGKGVCASYSQVKITCLLWNLSPPTCAV